MIVTQEQEELHAQLNSVSFSEAVENHLRVKKLDSYITAVVELMNELDIEEKDIPKLMSKTLLDKIRIEAEQDGHLFKSSNPMIQFE